MGDKQNALVFEQKEEEESADFWQATFLTPWEYFWKISFYLNLNFLLEKNIYLSVGENLEIQQNTIFSHGKRIISKRSASCLIFK